VIWKNAVVLSCPSGCRNFTQILFPESIASEVHATSMSNPSAMTHSRDSCKRTLVKTITWRCIGVVTTFLITYALTSDAIKSISVSGIDFASKTVLYFLYERLWMRIHWGITPPSQAAPNLPETLT